MKSAVKPPVELAVTAAGVVASVFAPNLNVIGFDGAKLTPDVEIVLPTALLVELSVIVGVTPNVNVVVGEFVPSDANTVLLPPADAGTTNDPLKVPLASDVTGATGVSVTPLNLNVIACDGIKVKPVTLIV